MALKLNVGVSRKVGLPNYGSVGASCNLEFELDASLLEKDLDNFHARIRGAYAAAHQAVHDELARLQAPGDVNTADTYRAYASASTRNGNAKMDGHGCSVRSQLGQSRVKAATPRQIKAILAIARRQNADLASLLDQEFAAERPEELTLRQASELIDRLKSATETRP
jgi:hypothetical protein